ncbi:hypothetical protein YTPLAS18_28940 [Nitrospira sp.]|nr:hypothetical protein YTPLAS18_28940 [Nitrospira sp.]
MLDLVESANKKLVWRATIMAPLKERRTKNLDLAIEAVGQAFTDYPPGPHSPKNAYGRPSGRDREDSEARRN